MTSLYGTVQNVSTRNLGEELVNNHAAGVFALTVESVSTFDPEGGRALLAGVVLVYTGINEGASQILLAGPLTSAASDGDFVEVYPPAPEKVALVDLGDEGDNITVTVPFGLAPLLPDGFREEGDREQVLISERSTGEWVIADVPARNALVGGEHLVEDSVGPERLNVGVVTNLVVDPTFLGGTWAEVKDWQISLDPTGPFPGLGYLRSVSVANDSVEVVPYATPADSTYFLTDVIPVDAERTVRVSALVRCDAPAQTSAAGPVSASVRVVFNGPAIVSTAPAESLLIATSLVAGEWAELTGTFVVPSGASEFRAMVQTMNQTAGAIDFVRPEVQVVWDRLQSSNYSEGATGFYFDAERAQVQSLNVTETLGATEVNADAFTLNGMDVADLIDALPRGLVGFGRAYPGYHSGEISTTRVFTHELFGPSMIAGRIYNIRFFCHLEDSASTVSAKEVEAVIVYTGDGSAPPITGGLWLDGAQARINWPAGSDAHHVSIDCTYLPQGNYHTTRFRIFFVRIGGSGSFHVMGDDANRPAEFSIFDMGRVPSDLTYLSGNNGEIAVLSKANSQSADPDPVTTYTKTFWATWTQSYDSDKGQRNGGDGGDLYQGYISGTHGNSRSLFGFDYAAIQSALSGATVKKVEIIFKVKHSWSPSAGISVYLSSHDYSSKGSTWVDSQVNEDRYHWSGQKEGSTYTHTITGMGSSLKSGAIRGFGFGPGPSNSSSSYYGYMYGGTSSSSRPRLKITYSK